MTEKIAVTVDWTPEVLAIGGRAFQKAKPKKPLILMLLAIVPITFAIIVFGDQLGLAIRGRDAVSSGSYSTGWLDAIIVYSVTIVAVIFIAARVRQAASGQSAIESPFLSRPWTLTLGVDGIQTKGPYSSGHIDWAAVTDVAYTKSVIVLSMGGGGILPLPHIGLPHGVTPEDLAPRIEAWRTASDF